MDSKRGWRSRSKSQSAKQIKTRISRSVPVSKRVSYAPATRVVVSRGVGLGQSAKTVLKTEFYANLATASSGIWTGYLKPGSAFDPTGDIAAIQPALYDQWAAMYGRYVVEKAFVKIEFAKSLSVSSENQPYLVAAYPSTSSTALATFQGAASQPFGKSLMFTPSDTTSTNCFVFKLDHAKVLGRKGAVTAEDNGALTSSDPNPGEFMVLPIFLQSASPSTAGVTARFVIYQTVHFDRRINVVDA